MPTPGLQNDGGVSGAARTDLNFAMWSGRFVLAYPANELVQPSIAILQRIMRSAAFSNAGRCGPFS